MEQALKTVKDFSPFGWGITVLVLVLQFINEREQNFNTRDTQALIQLQTRVEAVEKATNATNLELREIRLEFATLKKIGCTSLTKAQKQVLVACGD